MATEIHGMRSQILANARIMLKTSSATYINPGSHATLVGWEPHCNFEVVVFGDSTAGMTAAVMIGLTPAIEGSRAMSVEGALRKLLNATCELLKSYVPKIGTHQRNIHGGGVFDEDMIKEDVLDGGTTT